MTRTIRHLLLAALLVPAALLAACEDTDVGLATRAGVEAVKAVTLDHADVVALARRAAAQADAQHRVAPPGSPYAKRLARLIAGRENARGYAFDHKVYLSDNVNAFAMADGTIRIYSGLMDMMDDDELLFVVGHEQGHVVNKDVAQKLRLAYAGSALRAALASQQNEIGAVARSVVGAFAQQLVGAQFSQHEERAADDYGLAFLQEAGADPRAAVSALNKLARLGGSHTFLSSHPAPRERAGRIALALADPGTAPGAAPAEPTLAERISRLWSWLVSLWPLGGPDPTGA